jgi:hypothetical protein
MLGLQIPHPLPLSQPLDDNQVSEVWQWIVWASEQSPQQRVPPEKFQHLTSGDWLMLVNELNLILNEVREYPVQ